MGVEAIMIGGVVVLWMLIIIVAINDIQRTHELIMQDENERMKEAVLPDLEYEQSEHIYKSNVGDPIFVAIQAP